MGAAVGKVFHEFGTNTIFQPHGRPQWASHWNVTEQTTYRANRMSRKTWISAVVKAAKDDKTPAPWSRGKRRAEMIARRKEAEKAA